MKRPTITPDRWRLMALQLAGKPLPGPPPIPGRTFRAPPTTDVDPGLAELEAAELWRELARSNEQDTHL